MLLGGNGFKREGLGRPSTPTPHGTSLSLQAVSQACEKEGEAQEGSSWLQLLRLGVARHGEQKLSQQERTTTICKKCSVYQAVERGERWQLASSTKRCQAHRGNQTYVAGILKIGVVDGPLENGCRMNVVGRWKFVQSCREKVRALSMDGEILKTSQHLILWTWL